MTLELRVLGPLEARVAGAPVELGPPKQRALLAHLLVRANEAVPVARLIDEVWPEAPPERARHSIAVYVSRLRKVLGDPARVRGGSQAFELRLEPGELDLERFRAHVAEARALLAEDPTAAAEQLRESLSLWRGRALADLGDETAVRDLVLELEEERLQATELRIEAELGAGRHARVVPELERLLAAHPAREALYRQLMLVLYRSGRQADALEVFRRARRRLRDELGVEPGPALRELEAAILRQDHSLAGDPRLLSDRLHLPAPDGKLVGRDEEISELTELIRSSGVRLVTVTGPPGAGKTRLAIAAAERLAAGFRDGVWFIGLEDAAAGASAVERIAEALGVEAGEGQSADDALVGHLRDRELLLVLDGFEPGPVAATVPTRLLREAPRAKLLVTSHEPLRLYGEHRYALRARPAETR